MKMKIAKYYFKTSYRADCLIKIYKYIKKKKMIFFSKLILRYLEKSTGVELSFHAEIGEIKIAHGKNIVIGGNSKIGDNVTIYNGVTIGVSGKLYKDQQGKLMQKSDYPIIERNCIIYTGAKILGGITIGENSIIGANSIIKENISSNSVVSINSELKISKNNFDLNEF